MLLLVPNDHLAVVYFPSYDRLTQNGIDQSDYTFFRNLLMLYGEYVFAHTG